MPSRWDVSWLMEGRRHQHDGGVGPGRKERGLKTITLQDYRQRMLRVLVHIQQNLDGELTLEELAGVAHFSPYHFHRIFRGMLGESLRAHVRRIRLERAAMRLKHSRLPIIQIALEARYDSHEAFTRAFRAMAGLSPSEFRSQQRSAPQGVAPSGVHYAPEGPLADFQPLETGGATMDVNIERLAPQRVAFMRHVGRYDEVGTTWENLCTQLGAEGLLGGQTRFIGICHDDPEVTPPQKIRYDACVTVDENFQPAGEIGVQTVAGGDYAVTTHHGPYERLNETYRQLMGEWIPRSGRALGSAPCLEIYLNDPESTESAELLTDIYVPLEPKE